MIEGSNKATYVRTAEFFFQFEFFPKSMVADALSSPNEQPPNLFLALARSTQRTQPMLPLVAC